MKEKLLWLKEIGESILISFLIVVLIRTFLFQPFLVKGESMEPNIEGGNYLIVDEITPKIYQYQRGEVVVFKAPNKKDYYIKRIIALPGERIVIKNGQIEIFNKNYPQGFKLDESAYLPQGTLTSGNIDLTLQNDEYFVLGDNRSFSYDSRHWGPLKKEDIIGIARLRAWPFSSLAIFRYSFNFGN